MAGSIAIGIMTILLSAALGYAASIADKEQKGAYGAIAAVFLVAGGAMVAVGSYQVHKRGVYGHSLCTALAAPSSPTPPPWTKMVPIGSDFKTLIMSDAYDTATEAGKAAVVSMNGVFVNNKLKYAPPWSGPTTTTTNEIMWWIQPDGNFKISGVVNMQNPVSHNDPGPSQKVTFTTQFFGAVPEATEWVYQILSKGCYTNDTTSYLRRHGYDANLHSPVATSHNGLMMQYIAAIDFLCSQCIQAALIHPKSLNFEASAKISWVEMIGSVISKNSMCDDRNATTTIDRVTYGTTRQTRMMQMFLNILDGPDSYSALETYRREIERRVSKNRDMYQSLISSRTYDPAMYRDSNNGTNMIQKINGKDAVTVEPIHP